MPKLREILNARPKDRVIAAPGVYDMVSLRMAAAMGFDALYMTGYGAVASNLGLPDAGLASYADMVGRVEAMARMAGVPLIADGGDPARGPGIPQEVRAHARPPRDSGGGNGAQDRGRGRSANKPRFSHHRPDRRANIVGP
jgi:2-methylisocitrate lyase-like PEP mutase family enzyme